MQALRETDPRRIGPYEVLGRLGAGGMGEVYLAESRAGLRLAVKVVRAEHAQDRTFRARFRQEVRAAQTVGGSGTYTARVIDADPEGERPWMATEFVEGPNLRDAVLDVGPLPQDAVLTFAAALGEALAAIHAKGMVHRDLKPSNILLAPDGPRVIDFGIVRALEATAMTRTGTMVGSVGYVSPEQIRNGSEVGPPSDVFALGAVLAYASSGREPFGEGQDSVILLRIVTRDFDLSGVPARVLPLVEACLREEPGDRPTPEEVVEAAGHSAASLRAALRPGWLTSAPATVAGDERWLPERESGEGESRVEYIAPATVTGASAPDRLPEPQRPSRRGLLTAAAGGAVVAVGGGAGWWLWQPASGTQGGGNPESPESLQTASAAGMEESAALAWQYDAAGLGGLYGPCVAVSPDGEVVYLGDTNGKLHALSRAGGRRWALALGEEVSTPVVTPDGIFCVVWDQKRARRRLCAVDATGKLGWTRNVGDNGYDPPVLAGRGVLVATGGTDEGGFRCYAADGTVLWNASTPAGPTGTPLVAGGVVYAGTFGDALVALDAEDGTRLWAVSTGVDVGRPALVGDILVAVSDGGAKRHAFSLDGELLWDARAESSGPMVAGNRSLAITTGRGTVDAVKAADGSTAWTYEIGGDWLPGPVVAGDRIYVRSGLVLCALGMDGKPVWSEALGNSTGEDQHSPVLSGRRFYVPSGGGIAAVDLSA
ncbi:PQQ-binding-like beta-propeller repeat protein [Streptomyces sp. NPDC087263]|uniref:protein kinase domain-containing protein n=1 Tax=Streptomyces sp. NPDC087263 TaxID=3365773 RepID=UPI003808EFF7